MSNRTTRPVYGFLQSLLTQPLTVARYLAVQANAGASIATLRLAACTVDKVHEGTILSCKLPAGTKV